MGSGGRRDRNVGLAPVAQRQALSFFSFAYLYSLLFRIKLSAQRGGSAVAGEIPAPVPTWRLTMQIGMVGLGRMGANLSRRLLRAGHTCVVFDVDQASVKRLETDGAVGASSLSDLIEKLPKTKVVWVMLPAGRITEETIEKLAEIMGTGDTIIDGGNTFYKDDIRRGRTLSTRGISYVDVGTSGGLWGLERGYCLMVGASKEAFSQLELVFRALAPGVGTVARTKSSVPVDTQEEGYLHCGPVGSGHFVKMVHNGIEYGLMQAYAEGFDIIKNADRLDHDGDTFELDSAKIAELWRRGSVVSSWLLDLSAKALQEDPQLDSFTGQVKDSGEGRWTVQAAVEEGVPANVLSASLFARFRSRASATFGDKLLSAMRYQFGGHKE